MQFIIHCCCGQTAVQLCGECLTGSFLWCSFTTESMDPETTMIYAYYKEGSSSPTFLYPLYALKEEKC